MLAHLVLVPNPHMQTPNYSLRRVRDDEAALAENTATSYQLAEQPVPEIATPASEPKKTVEPAAVQPIMPSDPAPTPVNVWTPTAEPAATAPVAAVAGPPAYREGIFKRFWVWLFGSGTAPAAPSGGTTGDKVMALLTGQPSQGPAAVYAPANAEDASAPF